MVDINKGVIAAVYQAFTNPSPTHSHHAASGTTQGSQKKGAQKSGKKKSSHVEKEAMVMYVLPRGLEVNVITDDITEVKANAIVSIEDEDFKGQNPIAKNIRDKAGQTITQELSAHKQKLKPRVGDVVRSSGGNLTGVDHILHAIMPVENAAAETKLWDEYFSALKTCIHAVLKTSEDSFVESVAMPMFGSGK